MGKFSFGIFVIEPFNILPNWKFALLWSPCLHPQKYVSCVGWVAYEWLWFRFYYWPKEAVEWCDRMQEVLRDDEPSQQDKT